jgi:hypothetical protein
MSGVAQAAEMASLKRSKPMTLAGVGGDQSLSVTERSPAGAILRPMKVEEIAEVVAKLPPDQLARFRPGSPHSRRAAPTNRESNRSITLLHFVMRLVARRDRDSR